MTKKTQPVRQMIDYWFDLDTDFRAGGRTLEERAAAAERYASDLTETLREHSDYRKVQVTVDREMATVCVVCNNPWETYDEDGETFCAHCGAPVDSDVKAGDAGA